MHNHHLLVILILLTQQLFLISTTATTSSSSSPLLHNQVRDRARNARFRETDDGAKSGKSGGKSGGKKGGKKMPPPPAMYQTPCCQICPHKFMASLEVFEATHEEKRRIYKNFHAFHKRHYSKNQKKAAPLPDSLDVFLEAPPLENPAPPAMLAPGDENCCAMCPKGFKDVERMKTYVFFFFN